MDFKYTDAELNRLGELPVSMQPQDISIPDDIKDPFERHIFVKGVMMERRRCLNIVMEHNQGGGGFHIDYHNGIEVACRAIAGGSEPELWNAKLSWFWPEQFDSGGWGYPRWGFKRAQEDK